MGKTFNNSDHSTSILSKFDKQRLDKLWAEYERTVIKLNDRYELQLQAVVHLPDGVTDLGLGDVITVQYVITNTGDNKLTNISLTNQTTTVTSLDPLEAEVNLWQRQYTITEEDIDKGFVVLTETATALTFNSSCGKRAMTDTVVTVITNLQAPTIYFYALGDVTETSIAEDINNAIAVGDPVVIDPNNASPTILNPATAQGILDYLDANYTVKSSNTTDWTAQVENITSPNNVAACADKNVIYSVLSGITSMTEVTYSPITVPLSGVSNGDGTTNYTLAFYDSLVNNPNLGAVYSLVLPSTPDDITFSVTAENRLEITNSTLFNRTISFEITHSLELFINEFRSAGLGNEVEGIAAQTDLYTTNFKISNIKNGSQLFLDSNDLPGNYVPNNPNTDQWTGTLAENIPSETIQYQFNSSPLTGPFTYNGRFNSLLSTLDSKDWKASVVLVPGESIVVYPQSNRKITTALTYLCSGLFLVGAIDEFGNTINS